MWVSSVQSSAAPIGGAERREESGVAEHLGQRADRRCHDRHVAGHRLSAGRPKPSSSERMTTARASA
jgi:hypothetical protein